jgi:hypothetical protein
MGKRAATFVMITVVAVILSIVLLFINRSYVFQEGNPLPVFSGICQLTINDVPYAKIKDNPPTYIARTGEHDPLFSFIETEFGVKFKEQKENEYIFVGSSKTVKVSPRLYSRTYQVWALSVANVDDGKN